MRGPAIANDGSRTKRTKPLRTHDIFGFNYDGSWGSSGLDLWAHHDRDLMAIEIARGKRCFPEWNTARWWLSHEAYQRHPAKFLADFESGLRIFADYGIGVVPMLFNRWRDPVCDFGGVPLDHLVPYWSAWNHAADLFASADPGDRSLSIVEDVFARYLDDVVGRHARDGRICMWDLCNEPLMGQYVDQPDSPVRQAELTWLTWCHKKCKRAGAMQPLTIGKLPKHDRPGLDGANQRRAELPPVLHVARPRPAEPCDNQGGLRVLPRRLRGDRPPSRQGTGRQ